MYICKYVFWKMFGKVQNKFSSVYGWYSTTFR